MTAEQWLADMAAEIDAEDLQQEADIVALIKELHGVREAKNVVAKRDTALTTLIKGYLERQGMDSLYDGEAGIGVRLQSRGASSVAYEPDKMPDDLILALHKAGALEVNAKLIKQLKGHELGDRCKPYERPGPVTNSLVFDK